MTKQAIVVGATSGIGKETALALVAEGYQVTITGRRYDNLVEVQQRHPNQIDILQMDVTELKSTGESLDNLFAQSSGVDLIVINAGVGYIDGKLPWEKDKQVIDTNVLGFTHIANKAFAFFRRQGHGHIVGISSVVMHRGGSAVAYNASKAFISRYLEGLRFMIAKRKLNIMVTDIRPGFVETDLASGNHLFWMISPLDAAKHIVKAIRNKKKVAYVSPRWRIIGTVLNWLPDFLYHKI